MAFLAKNVPKIFPSKSRKGHENILVSNTNQCHKKNKTSFLFRNRAREGKKEDGQDPAPQTPSERPQHPAQFQSPALNCNCNNSDSHSNDSTLESSPTLTPHETMDPVTLALPDLPNLTFPSEACDHDARNNNHYTTTTTTNNNNNHRSNCGMEKNSRTLAPRPMPVYESDCIPPVALVSVPNYFSFPPQPPASMDLSLPLEGGRYLTHAPRRTGEWDDATIESQIDLVEINDRNKSTTSMSEQQWRQDGLERDTATAQASAIMKPWIKRAARLALWQKIANEKLEETNSEQRDANTESFANLLYLQRKRTRQATCANLCPGAEELVVNHRALLSSLEIEKNALRRGRTIAIDNEETLNDQEPELWERSPRIVKWHMVRQPYKG